MWYVVLFPRENRVSAVPASWYVEDTNECFWPPAKMKQIDIDRFIKNKHLPEDDWKPYNAKLLGKYNDYKETLAKVSKAMYTDKLSSTDNEEIGRGKRKKLSRNFINNSSASEGDENASDDSLAYPNYSNLGHLETEDNHDKVETLRIPKGSAVGQLSKVVQNAPNLSMRNTQYLEHAGGKGIRKKLPFTIPKYRRKRSRSLSPENLLPERRSQEGQHREMEITSENNSNILEILQQMQVDSSEFRVQVLRKLNLLNLKLNDMEISLDNMRRDKDYQSDAENVNDEFIALFPLDSDIKLNNVENTLNDPNEKKKMVKHLARVGGSDVPEVVKRLMYKICTNEVGNLYSWDGAKGKKKFKNLKLAQVILDTVRINKTTREATDADIIISIKKWLVRCKDRMNLEEKRSRQLNNEEGME